MKNNDIIRLTYYKQHLILTLLDINSPKVSLKGIGQSCLDFNKYNMLISKEALECIEILYNKQKINDLVSIEIISKNNIWWMNKHGGIISNILDNSINVYQMPVYTICDNDIDIEVKNHIDTN